MGSAALDEEIAELQTTRDTAYQNLIKPDKRKTDEGCVKSRYCTAFRALEICSGEL